MVRLKREGGAKRRHLREHHGFLLGIPMVNASSDASTFVVWEGSHETMREAFHALFGELDPEEWGEPDATEAFADASLHAGPLVALHSDFDGLPWCCHRKIGSCSGGTRSSMLRGFPGVRVMKPSCSSLSTI